MSRSEFDIPEHEVKSLSDFLAQIEKFPSKETILFRGQSQDWPLIAKIGRLKQRKETILDAEQRMLADFKRKSVPMLPFTPANDLEWLAVAQHNGMATRMLDWSENPLAALWFAVRDIPKGEPGDWEPGVVWTLRVPEDRLLPQKPAHEVEGDVFSAKKAMVYRPRHIATRIAAQAGWFTVHHYETKRQQFGKFELHPVFQGQLNRLVIPGSKFADLRRKLASMGVNDATLFPDLRGLCDQIEQDYLIEDDERKPLYIRRKVKKFG